jgi:hypothetical protein
MASNMPGEYPEQEELGPVGPNGGGDHRIGSMPAAGFEPFLLQGTAS